MRSLPVTVLSSFLAASAWAVTLPVSPVMNSSNGRAGRVVLKQDWASPWLTNWVLPGTNSVPTFHVTTNLFQVFPCSRVTTNSGVGHVQPAVGASVDITVNRTSWITNGARVHIRMSDQAPGWYTVMGINGRRLTLRNDGDRGNLPPGRAWKIGGHGHLLAPTNTVKPFDADGDPGYITDDRPYCATESWNTLLLNSVRKTNAWGECVVLFYPGDYRPLGTLYANNALGSRWLATNRTYFVGYDPSAANIQAPLTNRLPWLEGVSLVAVTNFTFNSLRFQGYYRGEAAGTDANYGTGGGRGSQVTSAGSTNRVFQPSVEVVLDRCLFVKPAATMGIRGINVLGFRVQRCLFTTQWGVSRTDYGALGFVSELAPAERNLAVANRVIGFVDGISAGEDRFGPDYSVRFNDCVVAANDIQVPEQLWISTNGAVKAFVENGLDFKNGPDDAARPFLVIGNRITNTRSTARRRGSSGAAISHHFDAGNFLIVSNVFIDCEQVIKFGGNPHHTNLWATNNVFEANVARIGRISDPASPHSGTAIGAAFGNGVQYRITNNVFAGFERAIVYYVSWMESATNWNLYHGNRWSGSQFWHFDRLAPSAATRTRWTNSNPRLGNGPPDSR